MELVMTDEYKARKDEGELLSKSTKRPPGETSHPKDESLPTLHMPSQQKLYGGI